MSKELTEKEKVAQMVERIRRMAYDFVERVNIMMEYADQVEQFAEKSTEVQCHDYLTIMEKEIPTLFPSYDKGLN